jgi:16S rRNA processing protein RimM
VARVLGPRGLKGALRVEILTDWPEALAPGALLHAEGTDEVLRIVEVETGGRIPVLHLEGITTREAAERLVGRYLEGPPRQLDDGAYFWDDLIGLRVISTSGAPLGELVEIFRAGGNEVYRVVGLAGERLVPALRSIVTSIDLDSGVMVVTDEEPEEVR